jgi:Protein of unknown function (DUF1194)
MFHRKGLKMRPYRAVFPVLIAAALVASAAPAAARMIDLALVLAVDVSGSVNSERFELQRQGYAKAFASREVVEAIAAGESHAIAVTLVEWSGATHQRQRLDDHFRRAIGAVVQQRPQRGAARLRRLDLDQWCYRLCARVV